LRRASLPDAARRGRDMVAPRPRSRAGAGVGGSG